MPPSRVLASLPLYLINPSRPGFSSTWGPRIHSSQRRHENLRIYSVHFVPWKTVDDQCTNISITFRLHRRLQPVFQFITTYLQAGDGLNGCRVVYCGEGQGGISWYVLPSRFCVSLVFRCSPQIYPTLYSSTYFRLPLPPPTFATCLPIPHSIPLFVESP